jgi:hypothetical protein
LIYTPVVGFSSFNNDAGGQVDMFSQDGPRRIHLTGVEEVGAVSATKGLISSTIWPSNSWQLHLQF